MSDQTKFN